MLWGERQEENKESHIEKKKKKEVKLGQNKDL